MWNLFSALKSATNSMHLSKKQTKNSATKTKKQKKKKQNPQKQLTVNYVNVSSMCYYAGGEEWF